MPTFNGRHYVPILTWKRAEQHALQATPASTKAALTPLLEITSIPVDLDTGSQKKSLEDHVDPAIDKIGPSWGTDAEFFLDPAEVALDLSAAGVDGANYVYARAQAAGLPFVPVTGIARTPIEVAAALAHQQRGICLRLFADDLARLTLAADITAFMATYKLNEAEVDLVIDFESVEDWQLFAIVSAAQFQLSNIPKITKWRTLTLAACSFPGNLGGVQGINYLDRREWQAWLALHAMRSKLPRLPSFGDYAIQSPGVTDGYDPRFMPMTPAIRYTLGTQWLVIRGRSSKQQRMTSQYPVLAGQLIKAPQFYGVAHCTGCTDAASCAQGQPGFGSPETWRRIGTIHHLAVATAQVGAVPFP